MELSNKEEARKSVQRDPDVEIEVLRRADFFDDATLPLCKPVTIDPLDIDT